MDVSWASQTTQNGALTHVSGILSTLAGGGLTTPKLQLCDYYLKERKWLLVVCIIERHNITPD
jgi:hypothetical protein